MKKKLAKGTIGVAVLLRVLAGSVALAAWTASGTAGGHASAPAPLTTIDVSAFTTAQLYPGGTSDVLVRIHNPTSHDLTLTRIATDGPITSDAGLACDAATGVTYTPPSSPSLAIPAAKAITFVLTGVAMSNASADACQGATFTIPLRMTATGR